MSNPYEQPEHYDDCPYWAPNNEGEQCTCDARDEDAYDLEMERRVDRERDRLWDEGGEA